MNTYTRLAVSVGFAALSAWTVLPAACEEKGAGTEQNAQEANSYMGDALETINFVGDTLPNKAATRYLYVEGASWSTDAADALKSISDRYEMVKDQGFLELIYCSQDDDDEKTLEFMEECELKCAAVSVPIGEVLKLPGYDTPSQLPALTLVNKDGEVMKRGQGSNVSNWEEFFEGTEAKAKKAGQVVAINGKPVKNKGKGKEETGGGNLDNDQDSDSAPGCGDNPGTCDNSGGGCGNGGDNGGSGGKGGKDTNDAFADNNSGDSDSEGAGNDATTVPSTTVSQFLKKFNRFATDARPNTKARYYIYVCSASWCGYCRKISADVVKAYKEIRKDKDVELIYCSAEGEEATRQYLNSIGLDCAAICYTQERLKMPGFNAPSGIPYMLVVDNNGKLLHRGHGSGIKDWKQFCR